MSEFSIENEEQIKNENIRKMAIMSFRSDESIKRVNEAKRREDIWKDKTKDYVIKAMADESTDKSVINEIKNRASNISIGKRMINKKSTVFKDGVQYIPSNDQYKDAVDLLVDYLDLNTAMKQVNRINETHYNAIASCLPYVKNKLWYLKVKSYTPDKYFVIVSEEDPEEIIAIVLPCKGNYITSQTSDAQNAGVHSGERYESTSSASYMQYIWWSDSYHFTTDEKGQIIPGKQEDDLKNPIGMLPFVDFSKLKNGCFYNENGGDIADGSILINILLTDMYYISKYQGMGIGYAFGKGVPKNLKIGPSEFITLQMEAGDPEPSIGFASSNPPIDQHISQIEQALSLLLSTNGLDAGAISGKISAGDAASGIHEVIKKAENIEDVNNQREVYRDNQPLLLKIAMKWLDLGININSDKATIDPELKKIGVIPSDVSVSIKFREPEVYASELDKLAVIEKRVEMGLDTFEDALKRDNPELTSEQIKMIIDKRKQEENNQEEDNQEDMVEDKNEVQDVNNGEKGNLQA